MGSWAGIVRVGGTLATAAALCIPGLARANPDGDHDFPVTSHLTTPPTHVGSAVPGNGDVNPYGVAFVPEDVRCDRDLKPGDVLVSNFNNSSGLQGTGTTIVQISRKGVPANNPFFQGNSGLGLTTALGVLKNGFVLVGNVPSPTGTCTPGPDGEENGVEQGSLLILNGRGHLVRELKSSRLLNGPWDLTIDDQGSQAQVFVSNVLSGTVTRIDLRIHEHPDEVEVEGMTQISSGYLHECNDAALVVGPTGLVLDRDHDVLYVASTGDNKVFAVRDASWRRHDDGRGEVFISDPRHFHGPLGLVRAPNGNLLITQGDAVNPDPAQPSEITEYTDRGHFVGQYSVNPAQGSAFGLDIVPFGDGFILAAVDDTLNALDIWTVR